MGSHRVSRDNLDVTLMYGIDKNIYTCYTMWVMMENGNISRSRPSRMRKFKRSKNND